MLKQKKSCSNCIMGNSICVNSDIFCRFKGAVSHDYNCQKHRYMPMQKNTKEQNYKCIDCEFFIFEFNDLKDMPTIGLCQLFSVRHYDGKQKNTCSKFSKRSKQEVS